MTAHTNTVFAPDNRRRVKHVVRGLVAIKQAFSGAWFVYSSKNGRMREEGRFTGDIDMYREGRGPVSMVVYDDDCAECSFLPEGGALETSDERRGRR